MFKIEFRKIKDSQNISMYFDPSKCSFLERNNNFDETASLNGILSRTSSNKLVKLDSVFNACLLVTCSRSGEEFVKEINQNLFLYFSDGAWRNQRSDAVNSIDVVEFFDGFIDFSSIIRSEVESIRLGYHIKD